MASCSVALLVWLLSLFVAAAASHQGGDIPQITRQSLRDILRSRQVSRSQLIERATKTRDRRQVPAVSPGVITNVPFYLKTGDGQYVYYTAADTGTYTVSLGTRSQATAFLLDTSKRLAETSDTAFASYNPSQTAALLVLYSATAQQSMSYGSMSCTLGTGGRSGGALNCNAGSNSVTWCSQGGTILYAVTNGAACSSFQRGFADVQLEASTS